MLFDARLSPRDHLGVPQRETADAQESSTRDESFENDERSFGEKIQVEDSSAVKFFVFGDGPEDLLPYDFEAENH